MLKKIKRVLSLLAGTYSPVVFSDKAKRIFENRKVANDIVSAIIEHKEMLIKGECVIVSGIKITLIGNNNLL